MNGLPTPVRSPSVQPAPTAFISWAHGDDEWLETVLQFASLLRSIGGIDADIDLWQPSPVQWTTYGVNAVEASDYVIVVVSADYRQRWDGKNPPDVGAGAAREAAAIKALFEKDQTEALAKVKVVVLPGSTTDDIPRELFGFVERVEFASLDSPEFDPLLRILHKQPEYIKPPLGPLPALPPRFVESVESAPPPSGRDGAVEAVPVVDGTTPDGGAAALHSRLDQLEGALGSFRPGEEDGNLALPTDRRRDQLQRERAQVEASLKALETATLRSASSHGSALDGSTAANSEESHQLVRRLEQLLRQGRGLRRGIPAHEWAVAAAANPVTTEADAAMWARRVRRALRPHPELLEEFDYERPTATLSRVFLVSRDLAPRFKGLMDVRIANLTGIVDDLKGR